MCYPKWMSFSSTSQNFLGILREAVRWLRYAFKSAMVVLVIALAVQLVSGTGYLTGGAGPWFYEARGLVFGMLVWFLSVGLAAVLLRLIRTREGRAEEFLRPFDKFWTILGAFFIEVMISLLVWLILSPIHFTGGTSAVAILLEEGIFTFLGLLALAFFFPVPYLIVDDDHVSPVTVFRQAFALTQPHWRLIVAFALMEYVFIALPGWLALPFRGEDSDWMTGSNWVWTVRILHCATGIFTAFVAAVFYEGLRRNHLPDGVVRTDS
jgi:hypothetical protein